MSQDSWPDNGRVTRSRSRGKTANPSPSPAKQIYQQPPQFFEDQTSVQDSNNTSSIVYNDQAKENEFTLYDLPQGTSDNIHDEFLQMVRESGLDSIAKDAGVIQNGEIPVLRDYIISPSPSTDSRNSTTRSTTQTTTTAPRQNKRRKAEPPPDETTDKGDTGKKKRKTNRASAGDKLSKGLRHFSLRVCQKVESKRETNYNEVAEELVREFKEAEKTEGIVIDQKNIKRRVYDALNVLMAMNIISKDKRHINWIGLPTNAKEQIATLEEERAELIERIKKKRLGLEEVMAQENAYKNLIDRNTKPDMANIESRISLPFIIVNTKNNTVIECEVADDRSAYFFNFSAPFEIHDDSEILKRILRMS